MCKMFRRWKAAYQIRRELSHLSPRELADIGLSVWDIDRIAREESWARHP